MDGWIERERGRLNDRIRERHICSTVVVYHGLTTVYSRTAQLPADNLSQAELIKFRTVMLYNRQKLFFPIFD